MDNTSPSRENPAIPNETHTPEDATPETSDMTTPEQDSPHTSTEETTAAGLDGIDDPLTDSELAQALARISELEEQLARAQADHYNLNTEYGNYVRRTKEAIPGYKTAGHVDVLEALISVLDDIDAARKAGDLTEGPFASIATKLEDTLSSKFNLARYGEQGDDFDPNMHEALMARPNPDVDHDIVGQVLQPGYTMGDRLLRVAKVLVDNPA